MSAIQGLTVSISVLDLVFNNKPGRCEGKFILLKYQTKFQKMMGCSSMNSALSRDKSPSCPRTFPISFRRTIGLKYGTVNGSASAHLDWMLGRRL